MFLAMTTYEADPAQREEMQRITEDRVFAALRDAQGFLDGYSCRSADDPSRGVFVAVWENEQAATDWQSSGKFQEVVNLMGDRLRNPQRTLYEVLASTRD